MMSNDGGCLDRIVCKSTQTEYKIDLLVIGCGSRLTGEPSDLNVFGAHWSTTLERLELELSDWENVRFHRRLVGLKVGPSGAGSIIWMLLCGACGVPLRMVVRLDFDSEVLVDVMESGRERWEDCERC